MRVTKFDFVSFLNVVLPGEVAVILSYISGQYQQNVSVILLVTREMFKKAKKKSIKMMKTQLAKSRL